MPLVMGTDNDVLHTSRNDDAGLASGERLLVIMRMQQDTLAKHRAIRTDYLPLVGIVVPAGIFVSHSHLEAVTSVGRPGMVCGNYVRLTSHCRKTTGRAGDGHQ